MCAHDKNADVGNTCSSPPLPPVFEADGVCRAMTLRTRERSKTLEGPPLVHVRKNAFDKGLSEFTDAKM